MTATELLSQLRAVGVALEIGESGKLRAKGAAGVITPQLRAAIAEHKTELLAALRAGAPQTSVQAVAVAAEPNPIEVAREERRRAVLAMLERDPTLRYGWITDAESNRDYVIVVLAIRDVGTCELSIERRRYDAFKLLEIIDSTAQRSAAS